ncbi:MAG: galactose-1-phosphate uridylyltransferase [Candidatus Omnitrophica bacterium]|nr:galactose-1-phosphate uridylyltransferase [Candidatus Omnitrophota bacterium]
MAELRRDPIVGRWVIVDTDNPSKPEDFEHETSLFRSGVCPFCYGNEAMTPPEIESIRDPNTAPNTPGWQVRVVPNKFPALRIEGDLERQGIGIYDMSNGVGAHEVLIETPYHSKDIPDLLDHEIEDYLAVCCRRALDLIKDKRLKYILLFKNYGPSAGASLEHPHTQLIALPLVPKNPAEELKGAQDYFEYRERCIFCDMVRQEMQEKERIIQENKQFVSFCPYVSRFPFEIWIMPKKHNSYFCRMQPQEFPDLALILKDTITRVKKLFGNLSYNFLMHSAPIANDDGVEYYHWHIEFMPKLTRVAGFEWGTGFYLVPTPPELAAKYLREVQL